MKQTIVFITLTRDKSWHIICWLGISDAAKTTFESARGHEVRFNFCFM